MVQKSLRSARRLSGRHLIAIVFVGMVSACMPQAGPNYTTAADDQLLVRRTQSLLGEAGYDIGPVDGILGDRTRLAIAAYQRRHDMEASGVPNWQLVASLQNEAQSRVVALVQTRLAALGFYRGRPDGRDSEATRAAIRTFQTSKGLEADGRITPRLLRVLDNRSEKGVGDAVGAPGVVVTQEPSSGGISPAPSVAEDRRFSPGDHLNVQISGPDFPAVSSDLVVGTDGMLSLPDGGQVRATGLKVSELENAIAVEYAERYLNSLSISINSPQTN